MDKSVVNAHYKVIAKHYPGMSLTQLGLTVMMLGALRSSLGHEDAAGTVNEYIHKDGLSDDVKQCVDFLEREVLSLKRSKIDIDFWKRGNAGAFRRDYDYTQVTA